MTVPLSPTGNAEVFGAIGITVVSGEAFDAGIGSIPSPITEGDADWMYYQDFCTFHRITASPGNVITAPYSTQIDVKAMRKIKTTDVIVWVIETGAGSATGRAYWNMRTLLKLA